MKKNPINHSQRTIMYKLAYLLLIFVSSISKATQKPRVSIITSVYKGDDFIEDFLKDITLQTIFNECELLLINAASPGNEEPTIQKYCAQYPNIRYIKLEKDPGIYGVWNIGVRQSKAPYLANANLDDRRAYNQLEIHVRELESNPKIDLVYSGYLTTYTPNETFAHNTYKFITQPWAFSPKNMFKCLPGPMPVWRKSMHKDHGMFSEIFYSSGDWEMWLRAIAGGSQFKKIPGFYGLYYHNPVGISTDNDKKKSDRRNLENDFIIKQYNYLWN